jgi:hypothetical protein
MMHLKIYTRRFVMLKVGKRCPFGKLRASVPTTAKPFDRLRTGNPP